jgi:hypothetical protein
MLLLRRRKSNHRIIFCCRMLFRQSWSDEKRFCWRLLITCQKILFWCLRLVTVKSGRKLTHQYVFITWTWYLQSDTSRSAVEKCIQSAHCFKKSLCHAMKQQIALVLILMHSPCDYLLASIKFKSCIKYCHFSVCDCDNWRSAKHLSCGMCVCEGCECIKTYFRFS